MTIFDKILAGAIPSEKVYETEEVLAFKDINAIAPIHVLVIPKRKMRNFSDFGQADPAYIGRFMQEIATVAALLGLERTGYRVVFNTGADAQQTVEYLHAHLIGGRQMGWPPG